VLTISNVEESTASLGNLFQNLKKKAYV